jgi:hypothetical protein
LRVIDFVATYSYCIDSLPTIPETADEADVFFWAGFYGENRLTKRERLLPAMKHVIGCGRVLAVVGTHHAKWQARPPPLGLEGLPRMCFVEQWNGFLDERIEGAMTDSQGL